MSAPVAERPGPGRRLLGWLGGLEDGAVLRAAFLAMLAGTAAVLFVDYRELGEADAAAFAPGRPVLPAFRPDGPAAAPGPEVTTDRETLLQPLSLALEGGGVLRLTGSIDVGAAGRFAAEISARGEYVQTVALDSPGGSVEDALAIGALIREKGYATEVAAGALCASSCPLVLAGGSERRAAEGAAVGVHQIYAAAGAAVPAGIRTADTAMRDAQTTTATITRHLSAMGVDPALWLHALETPPDRLYYLSADEMTALRLVTPAAAAQ